MYVCKCINFGSMFHYHCQEVHQANGLYDVILLYLNGSGFFHFPYISFTIIKKMYNNKIMWTHETYTFTGNFVCACLLPPFSNHQQSLIVIISLYKCYYNCYKEEENNVGKTTSNNNKHVSRFSIHFIFMYLPEKYFIKDVSAELYFSQ